MSTAARKARKRAHHAAQSQASKDLTRYIHNEKQGTPLLERYENQPHAYTDTSRRDYRHGVPARARKRLKSILDVLKPVDSEAAAADDQWQEEPGTKLDPKPYRIGRKRYTIEEMANDKVHSANEYTWSPRKGFEQDSKAY